MRPHFFWVTLAPAATDSTGEMSEAPKNPYLRNAVMTATPEQLHLMLYDGAIRYAGQAREAIEKKEFEKSFHALMRAQKIVLEMRNGLNYDVNRELCERMASTYNFLYRKLVDACVERDVKAIDDAVRVLRIERETWKILVEKVNELKDDGEGTTGGVEPKPEHAEGKGAPVGFSIEA